MEPGWALFHSAVLTVNCREISWRRNILSDQYPEEAGALVTPEAMMYDDVHTLVVEG